MKLSRRDLLTALAAGLSLGGCATVKKPLAWFKGRPERLVFATVNDLHLKDAASTGLLNRTMDAIRKDPDIAFVVVLGDLTTSGELSEFRLAKASLGRLEKPYYCVPGNHDVTETAAPLANYARVFEASQWRFEEKGWAFLGLDTCDGKEGRVTPARLEWMREQLHKIGKRKPLVVFCHHPLRPAKGGDATKNADEVLKLLDGCNLKMVTSGHYHGNDEQNADGVVFLTTACCTTTRDNFDKSTDKGYRRYVIHRDDTLTHEFVPVA